jgi:hypothetical protein
MPTAYNEILYFLLAYFVHHHDSIPHPTITAMFSCSFCNAGCCSGRNNTVCCSKQRSVTHFIHLFLLIIGLCILLRVYQLNIGTTSVRNKVFLVLDFIVNFSHYMFRPRLANIFRWFANRNISKASHYIFHGSVE